MSYAIAAAGTGGHVFPALAVGEALVELGVDRSEVFYVGGDRLEAEVFPQAGFDFVPVAIRGLDRRISLRNLALPFLVAGAISDLRARFRSSQVRVVLGVGGYITPPAVIAARLAGAKTLVSEQNAEAGLGNRIAGRMSNVVFGAFPQTIGLDRARWVGNPVRADIARFDRAALRPEAIERYRLDPLIPTVGVFGGSLGAGPVNQAVADTIGGWKGPAVQFLHLVGERFIAEIEPLADSAPLLWRVVGFEDRMDLFYAASNLVVARAGGAVAELAVTATPAVLIPGVFGSGRHQIENAAAFESAGAAKVLSQDQLGELGRLLADMLSSPLLLAAIADGLRSLAKPDAAVDIASTMRGLHD